jgi:peptidoglycan/xylan/chitin deacetylase (PgdA/CDA1 family)
MKKSWIALCMAGLLVLSACTAPGSSPNKAPGKPAAPARQQGAPIPQDTSPTSLLKLKERLTAEFRGKKPKEWGDRLPGIVLRLPTRDRVIALTFDACGGKNGSGYDAKLINYLISQHIPATLFINSRWIDANRNTFLRLARNPLFEIENHGTLHKPLSVTGRSIYGIKGTDSVPQAVDEVVDNEHKIEQLTGRKPKFFRPGTAYYDEIGVQIVKASGEVPVNFDIIGDAGATYNTEQVKHALLKAKPGSIIIMHFNQPAHDTAKGVMAAIPLLKQKGFHFVKLEDYIK